MQILLSEPQLIILKYINLLILKKKKKEKKKAELSRVELKDVLDLIKTFPTLISQRVLPLLTIIV